MWRDGPFEMGAAEDLAARHPGGHPAAGGGILLDVPTVLYRALLQRSPVEAQFDLASDWVERYGPTLEPEERAELDEQMAGEITAFDTQITAIPEAAAAGLTDYKSFLSFRGDYLNGIRNTDGQADMDVEALLYRVYGGTNWYRDRGAGGYSGDL